MEVIVSVTYVKVATINQSGIVMAENRVPTDIVTAVSLASPPIRAVKTWADDAVGKALNKNNICHSSKDMFNTQPINSAAKGSSNNFTASIQPISDAAERVPCNDNVAPTHIKPIAIAQAPSRASVVSMGLGIGRCKKFHISALTVAIISGLRIISRNTLPLA